PGIKAQLVVPKESPIQGLQELDGREVAFVTPDGFTGYWLPMDALLKAKVNVKVVFTGNQEASSAQLSDGALRPPQVVRLPPALDVRALPGPVCHGQSPLAAGQGGRGPGCPRQ